jgi:alkaline phosphatase D
MLSVVGLVVAALVLAGSALARDKVRPLTRIAFGSCADEEKPQPIWDAVLAYDPELFIFATTSTATSATAASFPSPS